jgi:hypothetical protein
VFGQPRAITGLRLGGREMAAVRDVAVELTIGLMRADADFA